MNYTIEKNHITQEKQVFDNKGLSYTLESLLSYNDDNVPFALTLQLSRNKRDCVVGQANCIINSNDDALLGDIQILDQVPFMSLKDKIYRLFHWGEPTNYQKRGLGTILLMEIINFAKLRQVKKLHGSLTQQDISKNSKLMEWYRKYGFQIENPTSDEAQSAVYRVCLYSK